MPKDSSFYTGSLIYRDINFTFIFDGEKLQLIPPTDKKHEVSHWFMNSLGNGVYAWGKPLYMEEAYLVGKCNETSHLIIFLPKQNSHIGSQNTVLFVDLFAYIICKYNRKLIDRVSFYGPEINCIHPVSQAISYSFDFDQSFDDGIITLATKDFDKTTTAAQEFIVDGKTINVFFSVDRSISQKIGEPPLTLNSVLNFEFTPTNDYTFIFRLWRIAKRFIQFLCYRNNISLLSADLFSPYEDGKHERFATFYTVNETLDSELDTLKSRRYIKQQYITGYEGKILSDIASNSIYTRHLPESYRSGRHYNAARFIMITAAFEWEFSRLYPEGIKKKESTLQVEAKAAEEIDALILKSTGKLKSIYKFFKKLIGSDKLQEKLEYIETDFDAIIGAIGRHLYRLNDEELVYAEMGKRLADQRNHFAHGDLNEEFIGLSLLDLMFLEYIIYAMQLHLYGVDNQYIQLAINDLFHLNLALPFPEKGTDADQQS